MDPRRRHSVDYPVSRTPVALRRVRSLRDPSTNFMSKNSVEFPITRRLVALRRVRSLRDPSTNSMSKLSSFVDDLNWETKPSNAIYLGLENGCNEGACDDNVGELRSSCMFVMNKEPDSGRIVCKSVSDSTPQRFSGVEYLDGKRLKQEMDKICDEDDGEDVAVSSSTSGSCDGIDSGSSFCEPQKRSMLLEKRNRCQVKRKGWSRNGNRGCRVIAGDVLRRVGSPYVTSTDAMKGLCSGLPLPDAGCGISSCWSRTLKTRESNLQCRTSMQEWPLLLDGSADHQHISDNRVPNCIESQMSLCQKFMPKSFKELVGQDGVTRSLTSVISSGRIASLYLFHGPRGTGKTSAARVFAAALNCISSGIDKPCGICKDCVSIFCERSRDIKEVHSVTINSVKKFRALIKSANTHPVNPGYKVYIIEECHLLLGEIWASILNKLEELPHHVFVMVTPDLDKLPFSVVSKSQRYHFRLVKEGDIAHRLQKVCADEGVEFDEDALKLIATKSNGSLWDAAMMLDHLSLLGKKITVPLVYEVNGAVCDDELLNLLEAAMSCDASSTVKKARALMRSRIDPLQLISKLANLIMDVLAGKCEEGDSEIRRNFFAEADRQQLSHVLRILSETEKQLRMSKNQTTWLTVALLQLGSAGASHDDRLSLRTLHPQDDELKHPLTRTGLDAASGKTAIQTDVETLELIWQRATEICNPSSLKSFLQRRGKLASVLLSSGIVVAELEFDHPDSVSKAEKSWKVIASALQHTFGYNVELRIKLMNNVPINYTKLKKPSFRLFSCSRRLNFRLQYCSECRSNASESSSYSVMTGDRSVETCTTDCGSQDLHPFCCTKETVTTIRHSDGNALSIRATAPRRSLQDTELGHDPWNMKPGNQSRRRQCWRRNCWRTATLPFRRAQTLIQKKLY